MKQDDILVHWSDDLKTGIQQIDEQHQTLARITNKLHQAIKQKQDQAYIDELMGQLANYIRIHFSVEESLMRSLNYPDYEAHKQSHKALLDQCLEIKSNVQCGKTTLLELLEFLGPWFAKHIQTADHGYSEHFHKTGATEALKRMDWMSSLWQWHD